MHCGPRCGRTEPFPSSPADQTESGMYDMTNVTTVSAITSRTQSAGSRTSGVSPPDTTSSPPTSYQPSPSLHACLAAYNNGILHGAWINADQDADSIHWAIWDMLKASPIECAEEWAIHDYEGSEGAYIREYEDIEHVVTLAAFIREYGALGGKLLEYCSCLDDAREAISDHYAGEHKSLSDFAQEITEETTAIPEALRFYIDYERMARDLAINDVLAIETGFEQCHIFWRH